MFVPPRYSEDDARAAIAASLSWSQALRQLGMRPAGGNWKTLQRYAHEVWGISTSHFDPNAGVRQSARQRGRPLSEILVADSTFHRGHLKRRLYAEGLKEPRCELCGQDEIWRGARLSLILDHINGVATDNRFENLQIVCPNCAATLDTHCGRNLPRREVEIECERCGIRFIRLRVEQRYCSRACGTRYARPRGPRLASRKVARPPYEQLVREIEESSYLAVGRRYGVSDNAIRKWIRAYERELGAPPLPRAA
jgi:hypothetical protein